MVDRPIGVMGATGQQGGAVVDALLARGVGVRAIVRDVASERSGALAARGVDVVEGDQDRPESLAGPLGGLSALFLMSTFADESGVEGEVRRGTAVADAAAAAGVPRVVYSSVGGAERHTGIPHFESKRRIEEHLEGLLPARFVRPAYFMENLVGQLPADDAPVVVRMPMPGDVPLQMVAVRDIGRVAAAVLLDPEILGADAIEIAGDELTGQEIAATIGRHVDRPASFEELPMDGLDDDLAAMFRWFTETPAYQADLARTREIDPEVLDLASWLDQR